MSVAVYLLTGSAAAWVPAALVAGTLAVLLAWEHLGGAPPESARH